MLNCLTQFPKQFLFIYTTRKRNLFKFPHRAGLIMQNVARNRDYEACMEALNQLQSNAQYIKQKTSGPIHNGDQLTHVKKFLNRAGLSLDRLDELSVIHIAGTKGKGTTCAFSERILRDHGYTTGFYSSPHLFEVRERIRINGKPISKPEFAYYFWKIYDALNDKKSDDYDMPLFFRFMTIMALSVFVDKKVDVAVVEVGIGGEYDCTNILRKVPVVGITSLGIDHVSLLGHTLESIAWNKAGIMKEGCRAFTVPQPPAAMEVLKKRSIEKKCNLEVVDTPQFNFPPNTDVLNQNAGLAVALCNAWLSTRHNNNVHGSLIKDVTEKALLSCTWPGRFQIIHEENITYYLDGAHTLESITICSNWFKDVTRLSKKKKALVFNVTGDRNAENLFKQLQQCHFHAVFFVTNSVGETGTSDMSTLKSLGEMLEKCEQHKQAWLNLEANDCWKSEQCKVFPTAIKAIEVLKRDSNYDLLITGSLHLIGGVLSVIDPALNDHNL